MGDLVAGSLEIEPDDLMIWIYIRELAQCGSQNIDGDPLLCKLVRLGDFADAPRVDGTHGDVNERSFKCCKTQSPQRLAGSDNRLLDDPVIVGIFSTSLVL